MGPLGSAEIHEVEFLQISEDLLKYPNSHLSGSHWLPEGLLLPVLQ